MAGIVLSYPSSWYILSAFFLVLWLALVLYRRDYRLKQQMLAGAAIAFLAFIVENIGIYLDLWSYTTGNWPLILWPNYFLSALVAYQIIILIHEKAGKR